MGIGKNVGRLVFNFLNNSINIFIKPRSLYDRVFFLVKAVFFLFYKKCVSKYVII